ncbi:hypothetical protein BV22DRAFT_1131600 [Leucogyrophana mollusca]|uniref:Uncharacterized protein n=1 Tax=Leucogyrophana mollusca TaxID=85980 RepID=A0ACB8BAM9_9AGAM|nr:hypothetical protein BV22DRAFT_1131600 [Leucogyrophana mollusca]
MPFVSSRIPAPVGSMNNLENYPGTSSLADPPAVRRKLSAEGVFQRVTTLFSPRRKRESNASSRNGPQSNIAVTNGRTTARISRSSSRSSSPASPDIRRPSGLGRRASSLESPQPYPFAPTDFPGKPDREEDGDMGRANALTMSSTSLIGLRRAHEARFQPHPVHICEIPGEILECILLFLSPHDLCSVALTSRVLCAVSRITLYRTLDLATIGDGRIDYLFGILATNQELAGIVHTLTCHSWPTSSLLQPGSDNTPAYPSHESLFFAALRKMRNLVSVSVPSFPPVFVQATLPQNINISRLQQLTITSQELSQKEQTDILSSLPYYTQLSTLSFPNLTEGNNDFKDTQEIPRTSTSITRNVPNALQTSRKLLKSLKHLHAPPELAIAIANLLWSPLHSVTLNVHSTLYTGLRPAAVARALKGVAEMKIVFGQEVDKRTAEKFLGAVGGALTEEVSEGAQQLTALEIEAEWMDEEAAETLYKIIDSVMPRFRGLRKLKLTTPCRSPQTQSLPVLPHNFPFPPLPSPARSSFSMSISSPLGQALTHEFVGQGAEKMHAKTWTKQCPSLHDIAFTFTRPPSDGVTGGYEEDAESVIYGIWFRKRG